MFSVISLKNFRSYTDYILELDKGVNIIVGPNASGKTNLLEALYMLARGKSFRSSSPETIKNAKKWARIDGKTRNDERTLKLQPPSRPQLLINQQKVKLISHVLPTVLFVPDDLRLISGSPSRRRSYIDQILSLVDHIYSNNLSKYSRALEQRNHLLKHQVLDKDELFVWDLKLAQYGSQLVDARQKLSNQINRRVGSLYNTIAGQKNIVEISYKTNMSSDQSQALKTVHAAQIKDRQLNFTTIGPHRDDLIISLNNHLATSRASRGESRSLVVALKIIETEIIEEKLGTRPLILLDDVFSELDSARRHHLTQYLKGHQTLITTTDADAVIEHFSSGEYKIIPTG